MLRRAIELIVICTWSCSGEAALREPSQARPGLRYQSGRRKTHSRGHTNVVSTRLHYASSSRAAPTTSTTSTTRPRIRPAGGRRPAVQRHRCGRPRGSVARAVALHCKSAAPDAASVRKEPYSCTLPGDRPLSFRRAGRSRTRAGRPRPALHPDGTTACPRPGARRRASPKAVRSRQRIARSPPPAALPDAAQRWLGAAAPLQDSY
mgnify:CR=1 FL=1